VTFWQTAFAVAAGVVVAGVAIGILGKALGAL